MLYISDLDGTLLNNKGLLTENTIKTVKRFINQGGNFTIATARSIFTSAHFIKQLGLKLPVILRNGAFIYEPVSDKVIESKLLTQDDLKEVMKYFRDMGVHPILHHIEDGNFRVDYTGIYNYGEQHYIESRKKDGDKRLRLIENYETVICGQCISICIIDDNEKLEKMHKELVKGPGRNFIIQRYIDNYSNHTWLEVNHRQANKGYAANKLLELTGETEYSAFGDNINDIEMLDNAESSFIPEDSYLSKFGFDYKKIKSNNNEGVADFLESVML